MPPRNEAPGKGVLPLAPGNDVGSKEWWDSAIKDAEESRDNENEKDWQANVQAYRNKGAKKPGQIRVNTDFTNVEQKKAQLFFRTPDVQLTAKRPEAEGAVHVFQEVINHKLGPHGVNAKVAVDECLFDSLCASGTWAAKVGYIATDDGVVQVPTGEVDPMTGGPKVDPMTQHPLTVAVPKVIHERYFFERISPAKLLKPRDFFGSDHDKAPWLGFEYVEDLQVAKAQWSLPDDFKGGGTDKHRLVKDPKSEARDNICICREIWYYASRVDPKVKHPELIRQIVFVEGVDNPVVHRNSPYQRFNADGTWHTGMKGYPVCVGQLRTVGDAAWVPSDCTISRDQVDELSEGRFQMVQQRKKSLPKQWFDRNRVSPDDVDRFKREDVQGMIPVDGNGNEIIGEITRAQWPRENFTFADVVTKDIDKFWALGSNQQGVTDESTRTATELSLIQSNINVRLDYERSKVLDWYVSAVGKLATLYQLFADDPDYIEIIGPDGLKQLQTWDRTTIQGEFAFSAKPDSAQRVDAQTDRKQFLDFLNMMAKNPFINLQELTRIGIEKFGYDPTRMIAPPQAPKPPEPNVGFSFKGDDFVGPASAIVIEIAQQAGYQISPQAIAAAAAGQAKVEAAQQMQAQAKTEHSGPADKQGPLNKHSLDAKQASPLSSADSVAATGRPSVGPHSAPGQAIESQSVQ